jgi:hypothetical protein
MSYKRSDAQTSQKSAFPQKAPPLVMADLAPFQDALDTIAPNWTVELEGICVDDACLVVVPDSGEDRSGPSFVVSREACGYRLDMVRWDEMNEVGVYLSLRTVVEAIRCCLAFRGSAGSISVTIH